MAGFIRTEEVAKAIRQTKNQGEINVLVAWTFWRSRRPFVQLMLDFGTRIPWLPQ